MTASFYASTSSSTHSLNCLPTQPLIHPSTHSYFHSSIHLCNNDQLSGYRTLGNEPGAGRAKVGLPRRHPAAKNLPAGAGSAKDASWSLGHEDLLEEETATHSGILAWRIPWPEEPGKLQSMGHKESDTTERLTLNLKLIESKKRIKIIVHNHVFS